MLIQDLLKISEDLGKNADEFTKSAHKARLDKMKPEDLHAHIFKHASEAKYNDEKPSEADIRGHAIRTAERLGHEDKNVYWNKIKHLVKEDEEITEAVSHDMIMKIGREAGVDFEDDDGKQAMAAIRLAYLKGYADGFKAASGDK